MSTFHDQDLESLIEDLKAALEDDNALSILLTKRSKKELDKLYELCDSYTYSYDKLFETGRLK